MREALPMVLNYGFESLGLHRIEATVESENEKSKNVLKAMGFRWEGCMKDYEWKNGHPIDLEIYAILKR